jgi:CHAT domain-containing protein
VGDRAGEAAQLIKLGNAQYARGLKDDAMKTFKQARTLMQQVGDRRGEVTALGCLAAIEFENGDLPQARSDNESAINISQLLRSKIPAGDNRATYASMVHGLYEREINILMSLHTKEPSKGFDVLALEASEQGRSRSLVEMLNESGVNIRNGADPELLRQERAIEKSLNSMSAQLSESPAPQDAAKQLRDLLDRYDELQTQIRISNPRYASLVHPDAPSVRAIQTQLLTPDTLLLEYTLGEGQSYLWAVGPEKVSVYTLPGRFDLEWAAGKFGAKVQAAPPLSADEMHEAGLELSKMLLGPVAGELGNKRLVIVAEGMLSTLPFGLLSSPAGGQQGVARELAMDHEIVYLPAASTLFALRRESAARRAPSKLVAILADPVFSRNDERVKDRQGQSHGGQTGVDSHGAGSQQPNGGSASAALTAQSSGEDLWTKLLETWDDVTGITSGASLRRLRYTRREADGISALVPEDQRDEVTDFKASKATVNSGLLREYRIVHIATHGILNGIHPELSGLVLSMVDEKGDAQDGFLQLHEIYNLNLAADLVVLSACETGLGKNVTGEGVVGLTRGFMYAGSPRVIVSLWNVNDLATAELMQRFYRGMLTDRLPASKALQLSQVSMSKDSRWSAPYYWAGFVLYGEWE